MFYLSVGCMFKNESHLLREWLAHYVHHGVDHFYLINDGSTDDYQSVLNDYQDKVTLFEATWDYYLGRQRDMYNYYILPKLKSTQWLLMIDMDEFVWSPQGIDLKTILR